MVLERFFTIFNSTTPPLILPLNAMERFSIIKKTNQWWKVILAFWIFMTAGAFMSFGIFLIRQSTAMGHLLLPLGALIGFIAAVFACVSVRCPKCGTSWVWFAISKKSPNEWYCWLMELDTCSKCGENGI